MSWKDDLWAWIKTAPLPVVLALCTLTAVVTIAHDRSQVVAKSEAADQKAERAIAEIDIARALLSEGARRDAETNEAILRLEAKIDTILLQVGELRGARKEARH